jgi:hypothetical protein
MTSFDFLSLKNDVKVPIKKYAEKHFFCWHLEGQ